MLTLFAMFQTPNPAWPPPSQFLPSQHRNLKDLSMKSWRIAGSGPLPWRKAPSFFNDSGFQFELQPGMPVEVDVVHGIDRFGISERFSISSLEKKQENFFERLIDGKPIVGPSETLEDGISGDYLHYHFSACEETHGYLSFSCSL